MKLDIIIEVHQGIDKLWYWRIATKKNRVLAVSDRGFTQQFSANRAVTNTIKIIYHAFHAVGNPITGEHQ